MVRITVVGELADHELQGRQLPQQHRVILTQESGSGVPENCSISVQVRKAGRHKWERQPDRPLLTLAGRSVHSRHEVMVQTTHLRLDMFPTFRRSFKADDGGLHLR